MGIVSLNISQRDKGNKVSAVLEQAIEEPVCTVTNGIGPAGQHSLMKDQLRGKTDEAILDFY